jgi:hypothetical protein
VISQIGGRETLLPDMRLENRWYRFDDAAIFLVLIHTLGKPLARLAAKRGANIALILGKKREIRWISLSKR